MTAHTRAGKLLESHGGLWFRELLREEDNERICKTVLFKRKTGARVAVLVPLTQRVSYKRLKAFFGSDCAPLSPDELRQEGFEPGEAAPMLVQCQLLVDPSCLALDPIQTGSGTLGYGIEWRVTDLEKLKRYEVVALTEG